MTPLTPKDVTQHGADIVIRYDGATCCVTCEPTEYATEIAQWLRDYLSVADVAPTQEGVDQMLKLVCGVTTNE